MFAPSAIPPGRCKTFLDCLRSQAVQRLVDVRKMPRSARNPQFISDTLVQVLEAAGVVYCRMPGLGGLRRRQPDSPNTAWRNVSFRGYADDMQTSAFEESKNNLVALAAKEKVALMCAEAVPWRCHRSLIADALVVRGLHVTHILSATRSEEHVLRSWVRAEGGRLTYPAQKDDPSLG